MTNTPQLQLSPSSFTVKIDGVTIEAGTWDKALSLLSQQSAIRRQPITFGVYDAEADTQAVFSITATGEFTKESTGTPERAALHLTSWNISRIDGPTLIKFASAAAATNHIQLVADISKAPIPVLLTGYYIQDAERLFTPDGAAAGSLAALSQEELESNLLAPEQPQPDTGNLPLPEPENAQVETVDTETGNLPATVPVGTAEHPVSSGPADEGAPAVFLFEDNEQTKDLKTPLWHRLGEAVRNVETPAILEPTRNKIIAGAGTGLLLLSIVGIGAALTGGNDTATTVKVSDTVLSVPAGYSDQPTWSLTLPEEAHVKATRTATALITDETLSLYSSETGEKIRDIPITEPITTLGEATVGGHPAIIWRTGNTLTAWTTTAGAEGELITVELDPGTTLSGTGQEILALTPTSAAVLTPEGLQPYELPADYIAMAATKNGILAGNFTPTVLTVSPDGQATAQTTLTAPHEGQQLHSWKHADSTITATVWAENPAAICDTGDKSGCGEDVTVALHNVADGTITASYDMQLEDIAPLPWIDGESDVYGALGSYVFDEATGQQVTMLPGGLSVEKIKGKFSMTTAKDGAGLIFHSQHDGYQLTSVLLAETDTAVILQQGDRVIAYPLALH